MVFEVQIPMRLVSEANRSSHEHWRARQKRAKDQRETVALFLRSTFARLAREAQRAVRPVPEEGLTITLTRSGPRRLDPDNNVGSFKHVADSLADFLGVNDRDDRLAWRWEQKSGPYGVTIRVEVRT